MPFALKALRWYDICIAFMNCFSLADLQILAFSKRCLKPSNPIDDVEWEEFQVEHILGWQKS